jgi:5-formyltetrahydrofolate cyclo-ligase
MIEDKKALRKQYKKIREEISQTDRIKAESVITDSVISLSQFKDSDILFTFISSGTEVNTSTIIGTAYESGIKVAAPLVTGKAEMCFILIDSLNDLKEGYYGIYEPVYNPKRLVTPTDRSLILVPGLAYDSELYRLGYGGGFYDKYLSEHKKGFTLGIGYNVQFTVQQLPREKTDVPLNGLITDKQKIIL